MSKAASDTLEKVSGEFEGEVLSELQEGRNQAMSLIEGARRESHEEVARISQMGMKQAESLKRQIIGSAELDVRNAQLTAMEAAVNEAFNTAMGSVSAADPERYSKSLERLILEGIEVIGTKASVACSAKDKKLASSVVRKLNKGKVKLTLDSKSVESVGGVVITAENGSVRFDNTFEARLERMKPTLRKDVAALLSGKQ